MKTDLSAWRAGVFLLFAACTAIQDFRTRTISLRTFLIFSVVGAFLSLKALTNQAVSLSSLLTAASSFLPGFALLFLSRVSEGAVGEGDALYFITTAFYVSLSALMQILLYGLLFCAISGLFCLCVSFFSGKGLSCGKLRMPFAIFLLPAACLTLSAEVF